MASSTARRLERIERLMFELPEVRDSFYSGEIGLAKVDLLLRVWKSRQMDKWMDRARNVTVRRLEMEVQAVLRRKDLTVSGLMAGNLRKALDVIVEGPTSGATCLRSTRSRVRRKIVKPRTRRPP